MATKRKKIPARRTDVGSAPEDQEAITLARMGRSARHIARQTGLSLGQATYTYHKWGVKITDWREGTSDFARQAGQMIYDLSNQITQNTVRILGGGSNGQAPEKKSK